MDKTAEEKIEEIYRFIVKHGVLVNKAKSSWGADLYKLGNLSAALADDGYTFLVSSANLGLSISTTVGQGVTCMKGEIGDLDTLYDNIFGEDD